MASGAQMRALRDSDPGTYAGWTKRVEGRPVAHRSLLPRVVFHGMVIRTMG